MLKVVQREEVNKMENFNLDEFMDSTEFKAEVKSLNWSNSLDCNEITANDLAEYQGNYEN